MVTNVIDLPVYLAYDSLPSLVYWLQNREGSISMISCPVSPVLCFELDGDRNLVRDWEDELF